MATRPVAPAPAVESSSQAPGSTVQGRGVRASADSERSAPQRPGWPQRQGPAAAGLVSAVGGEGGGGRPRCSGPGSLSGTWSQSRVVCSTPKYHTRLSRCCQTAGDWLPRAAHRQAEHSLPGRAPQRVPSPHLRSDGLADVLQDLERLSARERARRAQRSLGSRRLRPVCARLPDRLPVGLLARQLRPSGCSPGRLCLRPLEVWGCCASLGGPSRCRPPVPRERKR